MRSLLWLSVAAPLSFIIGLGIAVILVLEPALPNALAYGLALALAAAGILSFSGIIFTAFRRMQGRLERQADELTALYEAGMSLTSELSLHAVLERLVELGMRLTGARYGALSLLASDGSIVDFFTPGLSQSERQRIGDPPVGKGLLGVIAREGATLRVDDVSKDPRHVGFPADHPPMKTLLGVPVMIHGEVIGNLYLTDKTGGLPFDSSDEEMVRLLAAQAAIAIENAQLYEAQRSRAEEWRTLFELGEEVAASPDLQGLLSSVVEKARGLLQTDVATLMLLKPSGDELSVVAQAGLRTTAMRELRLLKDHGLQGFVIQTGEPTVVNDYQSDPRFENRPAKLVQEEGVVSLISVPFSAKSRLLGTLTVGNRRATRFENRQAELLAAFANWAAVAVETSRLYERIESLARLEERDRIAMDLHDGIIQSVYAVNLALEDAAERLEESPAGARASLDRAIDDLNSVIRDIRSYIFDLRPEVSKVSDLAQALAELVEETRVNTLIQTDLNISGELPPLREEEALGLYHIAQEALHNAAKHSRATLLEVRLSVDGSMLTLDVIDNGIGFDPDAQRDKQKQGLRNMEDRARGMGTSLKVDSAEGRGTRVRVDVLLTESGVR